MPGRLIKRTALPIANMIIYEIIIKNGTSKYSEWKKVYAIWEYGNIQANITNFLNNMFTCCTNSQRR